MSKTTESTEGAGAPPQVIDERVRELIGHYVDGELTDGELFAKLLLRVEHFTLAVLRATPLAALVPAFVREVSAFLATRPEAVTIVEGVTVYDAEAYARGVAVRVAALNALRPAMQRLLDADHQHDWQPAFEQPGGWS